MRNGKRILSLALLVLLVVLLMPVAAHADPPQDGCPGSAAGGPVTTTHSGVIESDTATCTKDGKRVWRCTKCGFFRRKKYGLSKFCENCGADMRGGEDGSDFVL